MYAHMEFLKSDNAICMSSLIFFNLQFSPEEPIIYFSSIIIKVLYFLAY